MHPVNAQEPLSHTEQLEEDATMAGVAIAGSLRAIEIAAVVLVGLVVCPPLAILAVLVAIPILVTAIALALLAAVLGMPYLIVQHLRGHPGGHLSLLAQRLRAAGRALLDLAPHRIHADARRLSAAR
jgi:hypothetical protein